MELQVIQSKIYELRGYKVMLDFDLAEMYQIETKRLKESVRRNLNRFPSDFMFELSREEFDYLRSQFASSNKRGGTRYLPFAFTEQGVAMLSSVINSGIAIDINISIMRVFVKMRQYILETSLLSKELSDLKIKIEDLMEDVESLNKDQEATDTHITDIYQALTELASKKTLSDKSRRPVGYVQHDNSKKETKK